MSVKNVLTVVRGVKQGNVGVPPHFTAAVEVHLNQATAMSSNGDSAGEGVVGILDPGEMRAPGRGVCGTVQSCLKVLVGGLWLKNHREKIDKILTWDIN